MTRGQSGTHGSSDSAHGNGQSHGSTGTNCGSGTAGKYNSELWSVQQVTIYQFP